MDKSEIIKALRELALYLEIDGENPFKIRSYYKAADTLEHTPESIEELINSNKLRELEGIGEAIEKKIISWYKDEPVPALERVRSKYPSSLLTLFSIPSLGGKRIKALYEHLHIKSIDELKKACLEGRVGGLPGFNKKMEQKILQGIELVSKWEGLHLIEEGYTIAEEVIEKLKSSGYVKEAQIVGSLRRFVETVRNVNILIVFTEKDKAKEDIRKIFSPGGIKEIDELNIEFDYKGIKVYLHLSPIESMYSKLFFYTGSKEFIESYGEKLKQKGFQLDTHFELYKQSKKVSFSSEKDIFEILDETYLPPEVREVFYNTKILKERANDLLEMKYIKGVVHSHSNYSDGHNSIEEIANYCIDKGYEYLVICDHSQSAGYANGLSIEMIRKQHEEIDNLNIKLKPFKIFKGIECDIRSDGTLDYSDEVLSTFDIVVISVHSKLEMDEEFATQRLLKAIKNPYSNILGHPSGRLLLSRIGYPLNYEAIFEGCVQNRVAVEINAQPQRLDLDWKNVYRGMLKGLKYVITTDAHEISDFRYLSYGISLARKGLLKTEDVLNTLTAEEFLNWFKQK